MSLLAFLLACAAGLALAATAVLCGQVACAMLPRREAALPARRPRLAVLVPAHDEAAGIAATLRSLRAAALPGDRILVVADNCTDDTARIAAGAGAEVVERRDAARRGKGYALDFGVRHLAADAPEIVVVVDADCEVEAGAVDRIARLGFATGRPVQALYLMRAPAGAGPMAAVAQFAQVVRNLVRPLGCLRAGLPCQLMGTGMAFPWPLLRDLPLASGNLVEDMKMGLDCARAGHPPLFCPQARVLSVFPASRAGVRSQRTRWEHGHLSMLCTEVPRALGQAFSGRGRGLAALAVDLCVPPLALLVLGTCGLWLAAAGLFVATGHAAALVLASLALAGLGFSVLAAWARFGRNTVSLAGLALAPVYAVAKLPVYARFLFRRQVQWVRSRRDG